MVVSDLSLVRLNSSQVDDSHQAVEATVSRPAEKRFSVLTRENRFGNRGNARGETT